MSARESPRPSLAWRVVVRGFPAGLIVSAPTRGKALAAALGLARDAGYPVAWGDGRATRSRRHDAWAAAQEVARCVNEDSLEDGEGA